nr:hypothetical protein [Tanacetum cinerariifolium]
MDLDFAADRNIRELSGEEAWEAIDNFAQDQKEQDNPPNIIFEQLSNLKAHAKRLFENKKVWVEMHREEVEETMGTPVEVEPLNKTQLEDLGLYTCNHEIPLSFREVPLFDELEPQPQPLPNRLSIDVSLGEERGPNPPIKQHSPDSSRIKVVDNSTIHTPPSPHMASFHAKDIYCYYHPCIDDPKKQYEFKPCLLGQGGSLGVDLSNWKVIENNLLRGLSLLDKPNEVEKGRIKKTHHLEHIIQQPLFQHMSLSHHNGVYRYYHPYLTLSVEEPSPLSVK